MSHDTVYHCDVCNNEMNIGEFHNTNMSFKQNPTQQPSTMRIIQGDFCSTNCLVSKILLHLDETD